MGWDKIILSLLILFIKINNIFFVLVRMVSLCLCVHAIFSSINFAEPLTFSPFFLPSKCSEKVALHALKASDWHLEGAFDVFYSQPQIKAFTDSRHLEELYNRYKGRFYFFPLRS